MNRPKLIICCGIPGSGKTYYSKKYIEKNPNTVHLSSDSIRAELHGDESIQGDPNEVFTLMQKRAIEALNNGQSVVYDSTNMTRKDRSYIISQCPKFVKIEAYVVWAPIETCIERDATRERTVGKEVIDRMLKRFQAPFVDEGFDDIYVHYSVDNFDNQKYLQDIVDAMKIPHDNPHHTLDIFDHCCEAARYIDAKGGAENIWYAALLHDVGKPRCKAFLDSKKQPSEHAHFYSHQCIGAYMSYGIGQMVGAINLPEIAWLISTHMDPFLNTKYYHNLPAYLKAEVDLLHEADLAAH